MTSPAGFWAAGTEGTPDNQNAGLLQRAAFASLPTPTNLTGMFAIATDGKGGNGGPPALYRSDGTATWVFVGLLMAFSGVRCTDASGQSISHNSVTAINFDTEQFDSDGFHDNSTNNTRLTVPTGMAGKYLIFGSGEMNITGNDAYRIAIRLNGSTELASASGGVGHSGSLINYSASILTIYELAVSDYVELTCHLDESASGSLSFTSHSFGMYKLD